jgi:hypothetical protein
MSTSYERLQQTYDTIADYQDLANQRLSQAELDGDISVSEFCQEVEEVRDACLDLNDDAL